MAKEDPTPYIRIELHGWPTAEDAIRSLYTTLMRGIALHWGKKRAYIHTKKKGRRDADGDVFTFIQGTRHHVRPAPVFAFSAESTGRASGVGRRAIASKNKGKNHITAVTGELSYSFVTQCPEFARRAE